MGYDRHEAIVIVTGEWDTTGLREALSEFQANLSPRWRPLFVGPIVAAVNGWETWFLAPDGSKEGWATSDRGDGIRNDLLRIVEAHRWEDQSGASAVHVVVHDDAADPYVAWSDRFLRNKPRNGDRRSEADA